MPLRPPRRRLTAEITLSLTVKAAALAAIALLLFGADRRPEITPETIGFALTGERP